MMLLIKETWPKRWGERRGEMVGETSVLGTTLGILWRILPGACVCEAPTLLLPPDSIEISGITQWNQFSQSFREGKAF